MVLTILPSFIINDDRQDSGADLSIVLTGRVFHLAFTLLGGEWDCGCSTAHPR